MTKQIISTSPSCSTDAQYRAWGSAHSTALAAAGLVQTADTGQINWTTVTKPSTTSTSAGYEVWRFNDSLQGSAPIYLKINWAIGGTSGAVAASISNLEIGTGSNGSGTITGTASIILPAGTGSYGYTASGATTIASSSLSYLTHGSGFFTFVMNSNGFNTSNPSYLLIIDRTRDSTGAATTDGAYILMGRVGYVSAYTLNFASPAARGPIPPCAVHPDFSNNSQGNEIYLSRHFSFLPNPMNQVAALTYGVNDISALSTFSITPVGSTSHTYMALGAQSANAGNDQTNTTGGNAAATYEANASLAVLWED